MTLGTARFDFTGDHAMRQGTDWVRGFRILGQALPAPPFAATTPYILGEYVSPTVPNGYTYLVMTAGTTAGTEPAAPTVLGQRFTSGTVGFMAIAPNRLVDTAGWTAEMDVRQEPEGALLMTLTYANGRIQTGPDPAAWVPLATYAVGAQVRPIIANGWVYGCIVAGTVIGTQPTWPTTPGQIVTDGTATWRTIGSDAATTNLRVTLAPDTSGVTAFANAVYDLELTDAGGRKIPLLRGYATLAREVSR